MQFWDMTNALNGTGSIVVALYGIHVTVSAAVLGLIGTLRINGMRIPMTTMGLAILGYSVFVAAQWYTIRFLLQTSRNFIEYYRATEDFAAEQARIPETMSVVMSDFNMGIFSFILLGGSGVVVLAMVLMGLTRVLVADGKSG